MLGLEVLKSAVVPVLPKLLCDQTLGSEVHCEDPFEPL
jgi:hypothetical protein